ncbi:MAG: hypothetical protein A6F71_05395 [Cycloclasticus sp. symbiont of Poecilosclerida sp. M]|nr:MAG: hypothetical protein A6F71_05395 [Cycloclasticus sp. symbiont of Poecilosclerida sp. M]
MHDSQLSRSKPPLNTLTEDLAWVINSSPICVIGFAPDKSPTEVERGFLVPKDWAKELNIIDNNPL